MIDQLYRLEWPRGSVRRPFVQGTRLQVTTDGRPVYAFADNGHESEDPPFIVYIGNEESGRYAGLVTSFRVHEDQPLFAFVSGLRLWDGAEEETIQRFSEPVRRRKTIRNLGEVKRYDHFVCGRRFVSQRDWRDLLAEIPRSIPQGNLFGEDYELEVRIPDRTPEMEQRPVHEILTLHGLAGGGRSEYEGEFEHIVIPCTQKFGRIRFFFLRGDQLYEQEMLPKDDFLRDSTLPTAPQPA